MSKESEARKKQGYVPKAVPQVCMNCVNFKSEIVKRKDYGFEYEKETNQRCAIGGFAVKKMGSCNEFSWKNLS